MPSTNTIAAEVCAKSGHQIQSLRATDVLDPLKGLVIQKFELACICCGYSLEKIRSGKIRNAPSNPKPNPTQFKKKEGQDGNP